MIRRIFAITGVMILFIVSAALGADKKGTELPQPDIPQPQFFCGYCHILTYPGIVQKGYDLWKKDKHNNVGCVECHYAPKGSGKSAAAAKKHIPKKPPERFAYVPLGGETVKKRPRILDASCMTANCHGSPDDKFKTKKIKFTEKVSYVHQPHFEKKNRIEGQELRCTSCHQHVTENKKFEVNPATCHLCHFTNVKFNEGRGRCELCHQLPKKPIQTSGDKPITHEMLKKAKVSCASCHIELIQAAGGGKYEAYFDKGELKTTLVLGAGRMKKESCVGCHDQAKALKEEKNKKLMHEKHVTTKNARCLDCHRPIMHAKADIKKPLKEQATRVSCEACHSEPHLYQRLLAAGPERGEVSATPDFMYRSRTSCLGCHTEQKLTKTGGKVMKASGKSCVRCHTKDHDKMLDDWKSELAKNVEEAKEIEKEALEVLAEHKPKLSKEQLAEAKEMLKQGREDLGIVQHGNGVHNKKYSIMLIDEAMGSFEDLIDTLEEGE